MSAPYTVTHYVPEWGPAHITDDNWGRTCFCGAALVQLEGGHHVVHRDPLDVHFARLGQVMHPRRLWINKEIAR